MVDFYLMAQLNGQIILKHKNTMNADDKDYEDALDKLADEFALEELDAYIAKSKLLTKDAAKKHLKDEFKASVRLEEQQTLLTFAIRCIVQDGKGYLNQEDWEKLSGEIKQATETIARISYKEKIPEKLFPFLGISDKGMDLIDNISREKYKEENFSSALAINAFLTVLDPLTPVYWLHLGICYQDSGFYDKAIKAYSVCHLIDPIEVRAMIFCSECYLLVNNKSDAKLEYDDAKRVAATLENPSSWNEQFAYLEQCLAG